MHLTGSWNGRKVKYGGWGKVDIGAGLTWRT